MRWTRILAALGAGIVVLGASGVAQAAPPPPTTPGPIAGYIVSHVKTVTTTFRMPKIGCGGRKRRTLQIGVMAPDLRWAAGVEIDCIRGHLSRSLTAYDSRGGGGTGGTGVAQAGNIIQAAVFIAPNGSVRARVTDLTVNVSTSTGIAAPDAVGVGAFTFERSPVFTRVAMSTTANNLRPLADVAHQRSVERSQGVVRLGAGPIRSDGETFAVIFRHP